MRWITIKNRNKENARNGGGMEAMTSRGYLSHPDVVYFEPDLESGLSETIYFLHHFFFIFFGAFTYV